MPSLIVAIALEIRVHPIWVVEEQEQVQTRAIHLQVLTSWQQPWVKMKVFGARFYSLLAPKYTVSEVEH